MTKNRPNANIVLSYMRDDMGGGDEWGTAMGWAFACNENLAALGEETSPHFSLGVFGPCIESFEDLQVQDLLASGKASVADVQFAVKCLDRYTTWLDMAGLSY